MHKKLKEKDRAKLEADVKAFLDAGGVIQQLPYGASAVEMGAVYQTRAQKKARAKSKSNRGISFAL